MFPSWTQSLDAAIASGGKIQATCSVCRRFKAVDLVALREKLGGDFCLINKRTRCRLKPGCLGWNRFHYLHGVMRPLWDERTASRWIEIDWKAKMAER